MSIYIPSLFITDILTKSFSVTDLLNSFIAFTRENYYVQNYLMLLFLSPILNGFIENKGKRILPYVIAFCVIEFVFDIVLDNKYLGFNHGFGLIHFILMYLIGRTVYLYKDVIMQINRFKYAGCYVFCSLLMTLLYISGAAYYSSFAYTSPLNILSAVFLFITFSYKNYHSNIINKIASSSFAVYILHTCSPWMGYIRRIDSYTLSHFSYALYLMIGLGVVVVVYLLCTMYDQVRIKLTKSYTDSIYSVLSLKIKKHFVSMKF